jgi:hypothetical protein
MTTLYSTLRGRAGLALLVMTASCSAESAPAVDAAIPPATYHQVEQLARPGINEALLITEAYNAGFNATAPSFAGVPVDTLTAVKGQAQTVLKALYLGACLINGLAGVTADTGVHPAAMRCHAIGPAIWMADGVTLTQDSKAASQAYADKVFDQFIPDVLRIDTSVASNYLTPCGTLDSVPLLCGGRFVDEDVIDVTYDYLLNGAANYLAPGNNGPLDQQIKALTSDGVSFSKNPAKNPDSLSTPDASNAAQGHPDISTAFPYSAAPF